MSTFSVTLMGKIVGCDWLGGGINSLPIVEVELDKTLKVLSGLQKYT